MLWAALLPNPSPSPTPSNELLSGAAIWALQFTPKVAIVEDALLLELATSARLFGGRRALAERLRDEALELGLTGPSWAPTSLAALAVARAGQRDGMSKPLQQLLDGQPLASIAAVAAHESMLARLGCRTLGDVRTLPRGGLARRFGAALLAALDQAYGLRPDEHAWISVPDTFEARLELPSRVEHAQALLFGARRLLLQLAGWLTARRAGVTAFTLSWCHDAMRSKHAGDGGSLTIRTAEVTRNPEHLARLLAEHLQHVQLQAPVGDLRLHVDLAQALTEKTATLLPEPGALSESLALVLERVAARLGTQKVLRPALAQDHRFEWMTHWRPAAEPAPRRHDAPAPDLPQPTFLLPQPLRLAVQSFRPMYQGPLLLLSGPHRVESGWWHRLPAAHDEEPQTVVRDYHVALSQTAGLLWIFQNRLDAAALDSSANAWFLAGIFA